jgi:hypothetical protein
VLWESTGFKRHGRRAALSSFHDALMCSRNDEDAISSTESVVDRPKARATLLLPPMDSSLATGTILARRATKVEASWRTGWNAFGPIPDGIEVLHRCDPKHCIGAKHLFLVTKNWQRALRQAATIAKSQEAMWRSQRATS